jgi:hypothetical protein
MITDETYDVLDDIYAAFGEPMYRNNEDRVLAGDNNLHDYIVVTKGEDNTLYYGCATYDEAVDACESGIHEAVTDWEYGGVWVTVAIIETKTRVVYYPTYRAFVSKDYAGSLDNHL